MRREKGEGWKTAWMVSGLSLARFGLRENSIGTASPTQKLPSAYSWLRWQLLCSKTKWIYPVEFFDFIKNTSSINSLNGKKWFANSKDLFHLLNLAAHPRCFIKHFLHNEKLIKILTFSFLLTKKQTEYQGNSLTRWY